MSRRIDAAGGRPVWARRALVCAVLALLCATGCGKKGPPLAPLGHRPEPLSAVDARQVGDNLVLAFDVPARYTDGDPLTGPPTVRVLRESLGGGPVVIQSFPPEIVRAAPGTRVTLAIPIAAAFEGVTAATATFRVETQGPKGKASAWSAPLAVTREKPLPIPLGLRSQQTPAGVQLEWAAAADSPANLGYNVYRRAESDAEWGKPLNAAPLGSTHFMDGDAVVGTVYEYRVEAVLPASQPPRASAPTDAIRLRRVDETPPDPPTEVRAVAGAEGVRIFWFPPLARDVAGYRIYRADAGGAEAPLADLPREATVHLDTEVAAGITYTYRVTALDGASPPNESEPSAAVSETVPALAVPPGV